MRITRTHVCLAGLICAVGIAFVPLNAAEEGGADEELQVRVYPVADLPIWMAGTGEFNLMLLTDSLNALVAHGRPEGAAISVHETTISLVVRDTESNHRKIYEYLSKFRKRHPGEEIEVNYALDDSEGIESSSRDEVK